MYNIYRCRNNVFFLKKKSGITLPIIITRPHEKDIINVPFHLIVKFCKKKRLYFKVTSLSLFFLAHLFNKGSNCNKMAS